jgi:hypothetical protein
VQRSSGWTEGILTREIQMAGKKKKKKVEPHKEQNEIETLRVQVLILESRAVSQQAEIEVLRTQVSQLALEFGNSKASNKR